MHDPNLDMVDAELRKLDPCGLGLQESFVRHWINYTMDSIRAVIVGTNYTKPKKRTAEHLSKSISIENSNLLTE